MHEEKAMSEAQVFALGITLALAGRHSRYLTVFDWDWPATSDGSNCPARWPCATPLVLAFRPAGRGRVRHRQDPGRGFGLGSAADGAAGSRRCLSGQRRWLAPRAKWRGLGCGGGGAPCSAIRSSPVPVRYSIPRPSRSATRSPGGEDTLALGTLALVFAHPLALGLLLSLTIGAALVVFWLARRVWRWRSRQPRPDSGNPARV